MAETPLPEGFVPDEPIQDMKPGIMPEGFTPDEPLADSVNAQPQARDISPFFSQGAPLPFVPQDLSNSFQQQFAEGLAQKGSGAVSMVGSEALPAAGATALSGFGPAGQAVGAMSGRAFQKLVQGIGKKAEEVAGIPENQRIFDKTGNLKKDLKDIALTGLSTLAFSGGIAGAGAVAGKLKDSAISGLAKIIKTFTKVSEGSAKRVLSDPSLFQTAKPSLQAGKEFAETVTGTPRFGPRAGFELGNKARRLVTGKRFATQENALKVISSALDDLERGTLTAQKAIVARQAASKELAKPKLTNAFNSADKRDVIDGIRKFDKLIEAHIPGFKASVKAVADSKAVEEFASLLPRNRNLSGDAMRTILASLGFVGAAASGNPLGILAAGGFATAQSPRAVGAAIGTAGRLGQAVSTGVPGIAARAGAARAGSGLVENLDSFLKDNRKNR